MANLVIAADGADAGTSAGQVVQPWAGRATAGSRRCLHGRGPPGRGLLRVSRDQG